MAWTHPAFEALAQMLGEYAGLHLPADRAEFAEVGLCRAMARAGCKDPRRFQEQVARDCTMLQQVLEEMTVGETYFFREPAQFRFIREEVLPDFRRRHGGESTFRAWSAACASGEEAYSLAILLEEEGMARRSYLVATDVSRPALARAEKGRFSRWSLRGESAAAARLYLTPHGTDFVLAERIRQHVKFAYLNLAQDRYPSLTSVVWGMHLILCRNVLIYLTPETIRAIAGRLYESLAPGGWLFTASSDPPLGNVAPFETVMTPHGVFYRRGSGTAPLPAALPCFCPEPTSLAEPVPMLAAPMMEAPVSLPPLPLEVPPAVAPAVDRLDEARKQLERGNYQGVCDLTRDCLDNASASLLHIRALANLSLEEAVQTSAKEVLRHALCTEMHYLNAVLLLAVGRDGEAMRAVRGVLYLDRTLALAHFTLASICEQRGDRRGAIRAYRNTRDLCAREPADRVVPLSDGTCYGLLGENVNSRLALLESSAEIAD